MNTQETAGLKLKIHLLEIEITNRCNLKCKHCYNRNETLIDMKLDEMIEYMEFANKHNISTFVITGGEACLNNDLPDFLKYIKDNRFELSGIKRIVLQSNGLIEKYVDRLNLDALDVIHLSFDLDQNTVREINSNSILLLAKKLNAIGIDSYLFSTIHKKNMNQIDEITRLANEHNIRIVFNLCSATKDNKEFLLTSDERRSVYKKMLDMQGEKMLKIARHPYINTYLGKSTEEYEGIKGGCTAGIAGLSILSNGDVIPCPFLRVKAGNVHEDNLENIWLNSEVFNTLRDRRKYEKCGDCKHLSYCGGCRSSVYNTTNRLDAFDDSCILFGI